MPPADATPLDAGPAPAAPPAATELLLPREVPLGGPRAMSVRRTLPQRQRSLIGPWCFIDHFGPDDVSATGGMVMPRHPHTGLATVTLLFSGKVHHHDSTGFTNTVRPGEVNLMIAGHGISHSEYSTPETTALHGVQLWYALPDALRDGIPEAQHHVPAPVRSGDGQVRTYLGTIAGHTSPVDTRTPAHAAELLIDAGGTLDLPLDPASEHGLLLDAGHATLTTLASGGAASDGAVSVGAASVGSDGAPGTELTPDGLHYLPPGTAGIRLHAGPDAPVRMVLVGGPPFEEDIVMWWNFVARSHEEIVTFRTRWQQEIGAAPGPELTELRFGPHPAGDRAALPAPELPNAQIRPRARARGPLS